jgi:hypothetical protein
MPSVGDELIVPGPIVGAGVPVGSSQPPPSCPTIRRFKAAVGSVAVTPNCAAGVAIAIIESLK